MVRISFFLYAAFLGSTISCSSPQWEDGVDLESASVNDPSLDNPSAFLVSQSNIVDSLPLAVTWHGFSASTFEWQEFHDAAQGIWQVSLPLLGGHGLDYEDFKKASWQDWQAGPWAEVESLTVQGHTPQIQLCSSTGCALIVDKLYHHKFNTMNAPQWIVMVDPIIFPAAKLLSLVDIVGPLLGNIKAECSTAEKPYWYCNRPQESLDQLMEVLGVVRQELEAGVKAPLATRIVVYKSSRDESADPTSALALYKGLRNGDGSRIQIHFVKSQLHVFTRIAAREAVTIADSTLQQKTFKEILALLDSTKN